MQNNWYSKATPENLVIMANWSDDERKSSKNAGYKQSSTDPDKMVRGNHWIKKDGESTIVNNGRHNRYGSGMSNTDFGNRIK